MKTTRKLEDWRSKESSGKLPEATEEHIKLSEPEQQLYVETQRSMRRRYQPAPDIASLASRAGMPRAITPYALDVFEDSLYVSQSGHSTASVNTYVQEGFSKTVADARGFVKMFRERGIGVETIRVKFPELARADGQWIQTHVIEKYEEPDCGNCGAELFRKLAEKIPSIVQSAERKQMTTFEETAGRLWCEARGSSSKKHLTAAALKNIGAELDRLGFTDIKRHLERDYSKKLATHNQMKPHLAIHKWEKLAMSKPHGVRAMRRLLSRVGAKYRERMSENTFADKA